MLECLRKEKARPDDSFNKSQGVTKMPINQITQSVPDKVTNKDIYVLLKETGAICAVNN